MNYYRPIWHLLYWLFYKEADKCDNIIKAHAGKALFIDFWATFCGPCRSGIEHTAGLRQQYKDHPDFQFIYITSDRESPEKTYNEYVEKNLKGEACYRIPQADYNYLRQLFHFNGIPHYEWIEKDGTVLRNSPGTYNLEKYLKKRFGNKDWYFPLLSIILALVYWPEVFSYVSYNKRRYYYDGPEKNTRAYK